jgi:hypothetical protein
MLPLGFPRVVSRFFVAALPIPFLVLAAALGLVLRSLILAVACFLGFLLFPLVFAAECL